MIIVLLALAGSALTAPVPAQAAAGNQASGNRASGNQASGNQASGSPLSQTRTTDDQDAAIQSAATVRVGDWIAASGDNVSLPYIIVDKNDARLFLFDGMGKLLGNAPVLIGVAVGDDATPGIGSKNLAEIGPAEKTTPAGRFLAKYGVAAGRQKILWVDYATSVALHPIPKGANPKERRRQRMLSSTPDDNRITFGCINVPTVFYNKIIHPLFRRKGGYVYVLPDTKPLEMVFPRLLAQPFMDDATPR